MIKIKETKGITQETKNSGIESTAKLTILGGIRDLQVFQYFFRRFTSYFEVVARKEEIRFIQISKRKLLKTFNESRWCLIWYVTPGHRIKW